jgi:hypothetical protein
VSSEPIKTPTHSKSLPREEERSPAQGRGERAREVRAPLGDRPARSRWRTPTSTMEKTAPALEGET